MLNWAIEAALRIGKADMGNLQILDLGSGALQIATQRGFSQQFLDVTESMVFQGTAAVCCRNWLTPKGILIVASYSYQIADVQQSDDHAINFVF
jgi:hypothetical protein